MQKENGQEKEVAALMTTNAAPKNVEWHNPHTSGVNHLGRTARARRARKGHGDGWIYERAEAIVWLSECKYGITLAEEFKQLRENAKQLKRLDCFLTQLFPKVHFFFLI